jgi:hypothetical protein
MFCYVFSQECIVTLNNCHASLAVTLLKVSTVTKLDSYSQREIFGSWDDKPMEILLPLNAGQSTTFSVHLYGKADFLLSSTHNIYPNTSEYSSLFFLVRSIILLFTKRMSFLSL